MLVDEITIKMRAVMKNRVNLTGAERDEADLRLKTLRSMIAAINNAKVAGKERKELAEAEIEAVLRKLAKSRRDNAAEYIKAGAQERADAEVAEANIVDEFLPNLMDDAGTRALVERIVAENNLTGTGGRGVGVVMKELKARGDVDTTLAAKIAKELV